jgi:hypothetical protein
MAQAITNKFLSTNMLVDVQKVVQWIISWLHSIYKRIELYSRTCRFRSQLRLNFPTTALKSNKERNFFNNSSNSTSNK